MHGEARLHVHALPHPSHANHAGAVLDRHDTECSHVPPAPAPLVLARVDPVAVSHHDRTGALGRLLLRVVVLGGDRWFYVLLATGYVIYLVLPVLPIHAAGISDDSVITIAGVSVDFADAVEFLRGQRE